MRIWFSALLWLAVVSLHLWVLRAYPLVFCSVGMVDPGGPIWMLRVYESDLLLHALLLLSPMVLMPLGRRLYEEAADRRTPWIEIIAAGLLGLSLLFSPVDPRVLFADDPQLRRIIPASFILSLPWFVVRLGAAVSVLRCWFHKGFETHLHVCLAVAKLFPAIGAAWLVAHRAGWTQWNFDQLIVLLTAAHFHHAGFTLPLIAGLSAKARPGCWTRFACVAILLGVPLVAVGITCTQFGVLKFVEPFGVTVLVLGALGVAVSQMLMGIELRSGLSGWTRAGFVVSGTSLLMAMLLAMGFGLRHVVPNWALTMPQMWMIHGTLNAFGFGLCGLLAWRGALKPVNMSKD